MNEYTLLPLEFPALLELLAAYTASAPGSDRLLSLLPGRERGFGDIMQTRIEETIGLLRNKSTLPSVRFDSPTEILARCAPEGAVLAAEDFLLLRDLLEGCKRVTQFLKSETCKPCVKLANFLAHFPNLDDVYQAINRVFDESGEISDRASPALSDVRRSIYNLERRIKGRLDEFLSDTNLNTVFQDKFVAMRNNRYVIPIRREMRSSFRGVVHDQSNSGRTLFIEPAGVVETSNDLSAQRLEERDEIRRILSKLSACVRKYSDELDRLTLLLTEYDCMRAVAMWGRDYDCRRIEFSETMNLKNARHPLLHAQFRKEEHEDDLVPLSLTLEPDVRILAITGSNTGGKTVVLKTIGLLQLAALAGLPIPCDKGSEMPHFDNVLADIGDEQSLQQNLSTFSSHLTHIRDFLATAAKSTSLILLDELGSGTDPSEGAALACAILHELSQRDGLAMTTTHLAAIKHYVHETPTMENAAVLFNQESLTPEYRLELGRPGASHAMTIARGLGIPESVMEQAESFLNRDELKLEQLLARMDEEQQQLHKNLLTSERSRMIIEEKRQTLTDELDEIKRERKKILNRAQREAAAVVDNSKRELERMIRQAGSDLSKDEAKRLRGKADRKQRNLQDAIETTRDRPRAPIEPGELTIGDRVWASAVNDHGTIISISGKGKRARLDVNGMHFDVKTRDLGKADEVKEPEKPQPTVAISKPKNVAAAKTELKLIGLRVEEGLKALESFLDAAALSGLHQLRIVHGFGTGAMHQAVHEYLESSPLIKSYRRGNPEKDDGGAGVTWVEMT